MTIKFMFIALALAVSIGHAPEFTFGADKAVSVLLPGNPLEGSRLFTEKGCLGCHSIYGQGGVMGPDLGQGILNRPLLDIAGVMWNHAPGMEHLFQVQRTVRPKFEPAEMASLLAFLYYLGSLDPPGNPEIGARLFREKQCEACHSLGGRGDRFGPALDKYSRFASPIYLTTALWNRGKVMARAMESKGIPRATFQGSEISDLMAYIRSVGGKLERVYIQPGNPKRGEALFREKRCAQCHVTAGHGEGAGPDLRLKLRGSLLRIAGTMWNHGPGMWAKMSEAGISVPVMRDAEMSDLISYLYFLQFIDRPGDVERGRVVFREKGCGACHALREAGGKTAPDLAKVEKLETSLEVITEMWNHASTMEERMAEQSVVWPVLRGGEMADLIAYLLSLRRGSK
jgi:mono/diheme cytochrome c family protein